MRLGQVFARLVFGMLILGLVGFGTPAVAAADPGSERSDPIELGEVGVVDAYEVSVVEVTPDANDLVAEENQFNDPPADGNQFFMVRVSVTYVGNESGKPGIDLNFQSVGVLNSSYTTFNNSCGVVPDGGMDASDLFEGGMIEYNICWQIATEDASSLVMYAEPLFSFDAEPIWFSLGNSDTASPSASDSRERTVVDESSRKQPISMGSTGISGDYEVTVVSTEPYANDIVAAENQFNDAPADGNQFFLARISVTYTGSDKGNPGVDLNFQSVGDLSVGYTTFENSCGVIPDEQYEATELFPGGATEFNVCWQIQSMDADSLVMYVEPLFSLDADPVWFSLDPNGGSASGGTSGVEVEPTEEETTSRSSQTSIEISTLDIKFSENELVIPANTDVTFTVTNEGVLQHDFVLDEADASSGLLNGGESATVVVNLPPGTYQFYCSVPGHKEAGMVGTLIVE